MIVHNMLNYSYYRLDVEEDDPTLKKPQNLQEMILNSTTGGITSLRHNRTLQPVVRLFEGWKGKVEERCAEDSLLEGFKKIKYQKVRGFKVWKTFFHLLVFLNSGS